MYMFREWKGKYSHTSYDMLCFRKKEGRSKTTFMNGIRGMMDKWELQKRVGNILRKPTANLSGCRKMGKHCINCCK